MGNSFDREVGDQFTEPTFPPATGDLPTKVLSQWLAVASSMLGCVLAVVGWCPARVTTVPVAPGDSHQNM